MADEPLKPEPGTPKDDTLIVAPPSEPLSRTRPMFFEPTGTPAAGAAPPSFAWTATSRKVPLCCWVAVVSSLTAVVLAVLLWIRTAPAAAPAAAAAAPAPSAAAAAKPAPANPEAFRAALQPYLDAAEKGDVHAMRMLGAMYYHGLDLPRNREEGLRWYRKAAASGSKVAQEELRQLE